MDTELTFTLDYWRDRANFFEEQINVIRTHKLDLQGYLVERLENENLELKEILAKLADTIAIQLKNTPTTTPVVPKDNEAVSYVMAFRSRRIRVDSLEMTVRCANCLKNEGIETLGDLCGYSTADLYRIPNFGRKSMSEVKELLHRHGLSLKPVTYI